MEVATVLGNSQACYCNMHFHSLYTDYGVLWAMTALKIKVNRDSSEVKASRAGKVFN